jgi:hypothetical protein
MTAIAIESIEKVLCTPHPNGFTYRPALPNAKGFRSWTTGNP